MKKPILYIIILISLTALPLTAFAVDLEQTYPNLPDTKTITETTSIPDFIIYLSKWAVIIAVLAVMLSLIIAGVKYLTSAGRPQAMSEAKDRIVKSFLGLTILAASFLILVTINPKLTVLKIEYVPAETGLFLFTKNGFEEFVQSDGLSKLNDLVDKNDMYLVSHDIPDISYDFELGQFVVDKWGTPPKLTPPITPGVAEIVNFLNTSVFAVGFWGSLDQDAKISFYPKQNYEGEKREYTFQGRLNELGKAIKTYIEPEPHGMRISILNRTVVPGGFNNDFFKTTGAFNVEYINLTAADYNVLTDEEKEAITKQTSTPGLIYPPLSLRVTRTGPGVYLYAGTAYYNEERKFTASEPDLGRYGIDFLDKAEKIKIVNAQIIYDDEGVPVPGAGEVYDYLAVVHEDPIYTGSLRIFFEQRLDTSGLIPDIDEADGIPEPDTSSSDGFRYKGNIKIGNMGDIDDPDNNVDTPRDIVQGGAYSMYGAVEYVSSIQVYKLAKDPKVCREVRLCTEKAEKVEDSGNCISYSYKGAETKNTPEIGMTKFPMPLYQPVNIPEKADVVKSLDEDGNIEEYEKKDFAQNIKSIQIDGDCLVALFENKIQDWPVIGPGARSQTFFHSITDLSRYEVGRCGSALRKIAGRYLAKSCAQSIAVYPIKPQQE